MSDVTELDTYPTLPPIQARVLDALLTQPSVQAAADVAGVSRPTVYRYLTDADFRAVYLKARLVQVDETDARMVALADTAVAALRDLLENGSPMVKLKAATYVLDAVHASAIQQALARIERLEEELV